MEVPATLRQTDSWVCFLVVCVCHLLVSTLFMYQYFFMVANVTGVVALVLVELLLLVVVALLLNRNMNTTKSYGITFFGLINIFYHMPNCDRCFGGVAVLVL